MSVADLQPTAEGVHLKRRHRIAPKFLRLSPRRLFPSKLAVACVLVTCYLLLATSSASAQGAAVMIEMGERGNEYYYQPKEITVPAGTVQITFDNRGERRHNWVVEALGQRAPDVSAGSTHQATFTLTTPGTYEFICDLPNHAARGMVGTLIVTPPGAAPAPAAQPTTAPATAA
ncbi:MAG: cupredoxin domain-containing protein, partial [Chloroflexota bacterium]